MICDSLDPASLCHLLCWLCACCFCLLLCQHLRGLGDISGGAVVLESVLLHVRRDSSPEGFADLGSIVDELAGAECLLRDGSDGFLKHVIQERGQLGDDALRFLAVLGLNVREHVAPEGGVVHHVATQITDQLAQLIVRQRRVALLLGVLLAVVVGAVALGVSDTRPDHSHQRGIGFRVLVFQQMRELVQEHAQRAARILLAHEDGVALRVDAVRLKSRRHATKEGSADAQCGADGRDDGGIVLSQAVGIGSSALALTNLIGADQLHLDRVSSVPERDHIALAKRDGLSDLAVSSPCVVLLSGQLGNVTQASPAGLIVGKVGLTRLVFAACAKDDFVLVE